MKADDVLNFWFAECTPAQWWNKDDKFDKEVSQHFGKILEQAITGELADWRMTDKGRLAEIIVLDQFSRNIYRNTAQAFSQDPQALTLSQEAVALGANEELELQEKAFLYMPFMHSESKIIHAVAKLLFSEKGLEDSYNFELKHKAIIDQFGRYPHRNSILNRVSTEEELDFLQQPNSSF